MVFILKVLVLSVAVGTVSFVATYSVIKIAYRLSLEKPERVQNVHKRHIPRLGGIAIVISFFIGLLLVLFLGFPNTLRKSFLPLYIPLMIIIFLGIYDDVKGTNALQKFFFQIICGLIVYQFSFKIKLISVPFVGSVALGNLSLPFTVLWIVLMINAFNLIDGLDGLLARIAMYASLSFSFIFFYRNDSFMGVLFIMMAAILAGFLYWNLFPAKIFLGDTGSMFSVYVLFIVLKKVLLLFL